VEGREFRDAMKAFDRKHAKVIGVSPDTQEAQSKFKAKHDLNFTLLCDVDKKAAQEYGVYKEKNMYGKKVMGIERTTFIIGEDGKIRKIFPKVKPEGHAQQVLSLL
jgi:peroxiredoxin Q/BCP